RSCFKPHAAPSATIIIQTRWCIIACGAYEPCLPDTPFHTNDTPTSTVNSFLPNYQYIWITRRTPHKTIHNTVYCFMTRPE
ncbi:hypothetical protein, partial [Ulvibacter litoralis]